MLIDILDGKAKLLLSTGLLEYETVLTRPEVLKMTGLDAVEVREVLDEARCQLHSGLVLLSLASGFR